MCEWFAEGGGGVRYDEAVDAIALCAPKTVFDQVATDRAAADYHRYTTSEGSSSTRGEGPEQSLTGRAAAASSSYGYD